MLTTPIRNEISQPTILLAEDDDVLREFVTEFLERDGYHVVSFSDGLALAAWFLENENCLENVVLVCDIYMPGASAFDLYERYPNTMMHLPAILITGFGTESLHDRAVALGASAVIDKPFDMRMLKEAILNAGEKLTGGN
ncbi:MAG: response regulator [Deltaproteobacteria bacterium]|nr:response regulator [Deltaproteobacteria bacterium]